ncbi:protein dead ringer isoform X2 [Cryptotermes secundus]|uniref:protein dead ringer isoform X2 n=1 Tax=Cryptotermes secundus TaxID=105785 RepID=UPI000CD7C2BE|nr:protein dead ringer isoform X2 [Cryptotermes secundus]
MYLSNNDEELSEAELQDEDSEDALSRLPVEDVGDPEVLAKLKQQEREEREEIERELKAHAQSQSHLQAPSPRHSPREQPATPSPNVMIPPPAFSLPLPFPFPHPSAAFLPPISAASAAPPISAPTPSFPPPSTAGATLQNSISSGSSHSSESSSSSQQTWSFEEQFKQLYEINDDPRRKEFLDDLFSFMQKRGTPINRLPIMAKSVLDLYELYNLVIARGGLVDVINKKLWQEIIKGLHLPSSITSAAFTLRTQYMKYLYTYECEKRQLSTPAELQVAIEGNRREGRRSSYGTYSEMVQRSPVPNLPPAHPSQMSPLSLVTSGRPAMNGNSNHHPASHPQPHGQPLVPGSVPGMVPSEFETRMMVDYVKYLRKELSGSTAAGNGSSNRQGSSSPPPSTSPQDSAALNALGMSRLTLWNLCNNNTSVVPPSQEPQREALNLEVREQQARALQESIATRESDESLGPPPPKRIMSSEDNMNKHSGVAGTHIKIASRGDGRAGIDNSLVVSMEINGVMYQGVLFAQSARTRMT